MYQSIRRVMAPAILMAAFIGHSTAHATTRNTGNARPPTQAVDLVLALDVSGSMSGLIDSARQRLWDVVNEFSRAQPQPDLRVSVISYGNPHYGQAGGFVRIDQPLTRDLDAVNEALFGFQTRGGNEYVARVIARARDELDWSPQTNALRVLFIAGNESASQDPQIDLARAVDAAKRENIVVNTIFCGEDGNGPVPAGWRSVAQLAGGTYASIDQNRSAVASIAAPQDRRLRELNVELNETYVPFGRNGTKRRDNQLRQDSNAATMSEPAAAARTVTKASSVYRAAEWDLVDAVESGIELETLAPDALPEGLRSMDDADRAAWIRAKSEKRQALRNEIRLLGAQRARHIETERERVQDGEANGFFEAMKKSLRSLAEKKGFTFDDSRSPEDQVQ